MADDHPNCSKIHNGTLYDFLRMASDQGLTFWLDENGLVFEVEDEDDEELLQRAYCWIDHIAYYFYLNTTTTLH